VSTLPADDSGVPLVYETVVPSSLQVSIVTFRPDWHLLERCLRKLALAIPGVTFDDAIVLGYTTEKVVATDFRGESCTSVFDAEAGIGPEDVSLARSVAGQVRAFMM